MQSTDDKQHSSDSKASTTTPQAIVVKSIEDNIYKAHDLDQEDDTEKKSNPDGELVVLDIVGREIRLSPTQIALGAAVVGGVVITPLLGPTVLSLVGFSASGPVAGSIAASIQASIGNVAAGSAFAGAQATAMGAGVPVIGQAIGGAVVGTGAWIGFQLRTFLRK